MVAVLLYSLIMFQGAKRSDMDFVEVQGGLFANSHEWHFQDAKRSDMSSTFLQDG